MKKLTKNFIAFTLSEMMIVLLILSVISAATLPSITQRNEVKPSVISSRWSFDYKYNKGYFYKTESNSDSTDVIVGFPNLGSATAAQKSLLQTNNKNASLRLMRPNYILQKVQDNASSIAFFGKDGTYHGKIAADSSSNIAIGKDVVKDPFNRNGYQNIFIGYGAAKGSSVANLNIVVGHNAAGVDSRYSILGSNNIVLGAHTRDLTLDDRNIIIGSYAAANTSKRTLYSNDLVAIGSYAFSANEYASLSTVGIGYWTGANSPGYSNNNIFLGSYAGYGVRNIETYSLVGIGYKAGAKSTSVQTYGNATNIGAFANYDSITPSTSIGYYANYANSDNGSYFSINIGTYAGAKPINYSFDHIINIGAYAGYASDSNGDLNIGYYAGSYATGQPYPNIRIGSFAGANSYDQHTTKYTVMIGNYAGYSMDDSDDSVLIGRYAGYNAYIASGELLVVGCYGLTDIQGAKKMCIGGEYPGNKGGFAKNGDTVSTMITPYYSSSVWGDSSIFLLAKYVASFGGTLTSFSDKTLKENVVKTKYGIDKIRQVNIYQYNFKGEKDAKIGVIAQELQKVFPEAVSKAPNNYLTVNSDWIIYSMVQALKDVDNAVNNLQKELSTNINLIKKLSVRLCSAEGKLDRLSQNNKDNKKQLAEIDLILSKMERK